MATVESTRVFEVAGEGVPTCHLCIRWPPTRTRRSRGKPRPRGVEMSRALLADILSPHGAVTDMIMMTGTATAYVTMGSEDAAAGARAALHEAPQALLFNLPLTVSFARVAAGTDVGVALAPAGGAGAGTIPPPGVSTAGADVRAAVARVPGLVLSTDFVSEEEEAELLALVDAGPWEAGGIKRDVQQYGARFNYRTLLAEGPAVVAASAAAGVGIDASQAAPEVPPLEGGFVGFGARIRSVLPEAAVPDQMTVNRYKPGEGISGHVDTHSVFGPVLCSLTLGAATVMDLRAGEEKVSVYLPRRSLLAFTDDARYRWKHGIARRKTDTLDGVVVRRATRTSLTYRTVTPAGFKCTCAFPSECDSQGVDLDARVVLSPNLHEDGPDGPPMPPASVLTVPDVEREHVHKLYDTIASHFSHTRYSGWPLVVDFLKGLPDWSVVADVGCGNGKYMGANPNLCMVPMDCSLELVKICVERGYPAFAADIMTLPLRPRSVDVAMCIAVMHHISTPERRLRAAQQLLDAVADGGEVFVQAWAFEQEAGSRRKFDTQDVMVPWCLQRRFITQDEEVLAAAHGVVDEVRNVVVFNRYCYVYKEGELGALFQEAAAGLGRAVEVLSAYFDRSNWCLHARVTTPAP